MFGLSWGQVTIIVLVGVFVLGPERIPTAVRWVTDGLRKVRTMAAGAQAQLNREIGPELDELRRQIADLQSLQGATSVGRVYRDGVSQDAEGVRVYRYGTETVSTAPAG